MFDSAPPSSKSGVIVGEGSLFIEAYAQPPPYGVSEILGSPQQPAFESERFDRFVAKLAEVCIDCLKPVRASNRDPEFRAENLRASFRQRAKVTWRRELYRRL
jgi:hypothetical protein